MGRLIDGFQHATVYGEANPLFQGPARYEFPLIFHTSNVVDARGFSRNVARLPRLIHTIRPHGGEADSRISCALTRHIEAPAIHGIQKRSGSLIAAIGKLPDIL
jgi:hypothetical protein